MARSRGLSFPRARSGGPRRQSDWGIGTQTGTDGSQQMITASGAQLALGGVSATLPGLTLVRTRGSFLAYLSSVSGPQGGVTGAFGIGVITDEAFAAGIVSIPAPLSDEGSDIWLYHRYFQLFSPSVLDGSVAEDRTAMVPLSAGIRFEVDSKAMRKVTVEDTIFAAIELVEVGTVTFEWSFNSRSLFKLS